MSSDLTPSVEVELLAELGVLHQAHYANPAPVPPSREGVTRMIQDCARIIFPDCYPPPPASGSSAGEPSGVATLASPLARVSAELQSLMLAALKMDHWERKSAQTSNSSTDAEEEKKEELFEGGDKNRLLARLVHGAPNEGHTERYESEYGPRHGVEALLRRPLEIPVSVPLFRHSPDKVGENGEGISCCLTVDQLEQQKTDYAEVTMQLVVVPFLRSLATEIIPKLHSDVEATVEKDVVTKSRVEVVLCYPGITGLLHQRIAHKLHLLGAPLVLTRLITEVAHSLTGIDIHPGCKIGSRLFIDHGTGIVVGGTAEIGSNVALYHGVCLGARNFKEDRSDPGHPRRMKHLLRHPVVEDNVTLYSHASVLGRVTVGEGAIIGGNVCCMKSVAPKEVVLQGKSSTTPNSMGTPLDPHPVMSAGEGI